MADQVPLNNGQIAAFFEKIADLMQLKGENPFKTRAYRRAAEAIRALPRDINVDYSEGTLKEIPGIGNAIADKITEIIETGRLAFLERLEAEFPAGVGTLMRVPEVGPKSALAIYNSLGIASIEELEAAAMAGRLRAVSGIGAKTEERILAGIQAMRRRSDRRLLGVVLPRAEALIASLQESAGERIARADVVGSLRRRLATAGNINLLVAAEPDDQPLIRQAFRRLPQVAESSETGARLHTGEEVTLRIVEPVNWGSALQYLTGSAEHNRALGEVAQAAGLTLAEGRVQAPTGETVAFASEEALYQQLGLAWIPPELREAHGELEAAREESLPALVELRDLRGDLHMHSSWSDGQASITEMAQAARALGYEYIVITDHSQSLAMTGGLTPERLIQQRYEIINVNSRIDGITVLQGAEVEIKGDGSLDYPDELLAQLDVVIASMHTGIRADRETVTRRMLNAIHNPHVDIIGHMTNRLIGRREGADLDMDAVLRAAAETGTILEINSQADRLDLDPVFARQALEYGCLLSIGSDAHSTTGLEVIGLGVSQARRAWAEADDVINTRSLEEFLSYIQDIDE
jgi:DNA polymerase (family X)